jgi:hypothetical protein
MMKVVNFIVKDLDSAAAILPMASGIEAGRATKGAALALKSRVLFMQNAGQKLQRQQKK